MSTSSGNVQLERLFVRYFGKPISVDPIGCRTVAALIEKVQEEFSPQLDAVPLAYLTLHPYSGTELRRGLKIARLRKLRGFHNDEFKPLQIRVFEPTLPDTKRTKAAHPSHDRITRWANLNPALFQAGIEAEAIIEEDFPSRRLNWRRIVPIYEDILQDYHQSVREIPEDTLSSLHDYLRMLSKRMRPMPTIDPSHRLHLLFPILAYVTDLSAHEDAVLSANVYAKGSFVAGDAHFDFMLKCKHRRVCIVEMKTDTMERAFVRAFIGMEVVAEQNGLNSVCGIVTNYVEWTFIRSQDNKIEKDFDTLMVVHNVPAVESLRRIAGKINAMLSDD